MTTVKEDGRGLYVMVDGQRARPGHVAGNVDYDTGTGGAVAGQQVRARLVDNGKWVRLRFAAGEYHWSTSSTARGEAAPAGTGKTVQVPAAQGGSMWMFDYRPGQVYETRDGSGRLVVRRVLPAEHPYRTSYNYVVELEGGSVRGPQGQWYQGHARPKEHHLDLVRLVAATS